MGRSIQFKPGTGSRDLAAFVESRNTVFMSYLMERRSTGRCSDYDKYAVDYQLKLPRPRLLSVTHISPPCNSAHQHSIIQVEPLCRFRPSIQPSPAESIPVTILEPRFPLRFCLLNPVQNLPDLLN